MAGRSRRGYSALYPVFLELDPSYRQQLTKIRLHQRPFRAAVLRAYRTSCAVCSFRHSDLLDAARINTEVLHEVDGTMLRHGIQEFHGQHLMVLPERRTQRPDRLLLDRRYQAFLDAS